MPSGHVPPVLLEAAVRALHEAIGVDAVVTDVESLCATSHDTWPLTTKWSRLGQHPNRADILVRATSVAQVSAVLAIATEFGVPVTVRALASSVTGQPLPVRGGIVLDVTGLPSELDINETDLMVTVSASQPGGELEDELQRRGFTLGHSPQSLYRSTVGGWVATMATGQFSSLYGGIEDLVVGYTVMLANGALVDLRAKPRAAMGPDLRQIFIGSEGTLGVVLSVTLKIFPIAEAELLQSFSLPDVTTGLDLVRRLVAAGLRPFLVRLYDVDEARHALSDPSTSSPVLFLGFRGTRQVAEAEWEVAGRLALEAGAIVTGPAPVEAWMARRFDFSSVENLLEIDGGYAETIEVAHYWSEIEGLYHALKEALAPLADEVLVHFSHVYPQGTSMYVILLGRAADDQAAIARIEAIWATTMNICLDHGAELSHHHGGGLARSPYAERALGSAHQLLRALKGALDPRGILNPGKLGL
jgi:alkyldihydroxyacetonephosphate synthase